MGPDSPDQLVLPGADKEGAVTYLGAEQGEELNACLVDRAGRQGSVLHQAVPAIGIIVCRQRNPGSRGLPIRCGVPGNSWISLCRRCGTRLAC
ncbi:MAG: hypothetical protein JWQ88_2273 [Rhodoferax sp.]|nr:hypothetical protein [Rhodoferax sp.]